jgi:DNA-binding NarL/FixJ family response regulator
MSTPTRVLIADDIPMVRNGVRAAIESAADMTVVGEAESGVHAMQLARRLQPDVILLDVSMPPGMSGLEASRLLSVDPSLPDTKIIILTVYVDEETVFEALRSGVHGFLLKDSPAEKIVEAVRAVMAGGSVLSPAIVGGVINEFAKRPTVSRAADAGLDRLTGRERDVFRMLVCGYHNEEIAKMLVVAESTVKSHVQRLYGKLGVRDRVQVVIYAYEHGLIAPGIGNPSRGCLPERQPTDQRHRPNGSQPSRQKRPC